MPLRAWPILWWSLLPIALVACSGDGGGRMLTPDELAELAAREDGEVLTYGMPDAYGGYRGFFQHFEQQYGIRRLDIDMSSSSVMRRFAEERDDPVVDAAVAGYLYGPAAVEQELLDCVPTAAVQTLPEWATGPADRDCRSWFATFSGTLGFMVNTEVIANPPRSWEELLREDLDGQISFVDPRAAATGVATLLAAARARGGSASNPEPGIDLLLEIARRGDLENVLPRQDYTGFVRGTRPIQINYDYNLLQLRETYGIQCTFVYPTEGTVQVPYSTMLVKDRPHPITGRLLVEALLGEEGQAAMAAGHVTPVLPGVPLSPEIQAMAQVSGFDPTAVEPVDWIEVGRRVEQMKAAFDTAMKPLEGGP